jgi:hypothetical protein
MSLWINKARTLLVSLASRYRTVMGPDGAAAREAPDAAREGCGGRRLPIPPTGSSLLDEQQERRPGGGSAGSAPDIAHP